jgi:hypothetical protein
MQSAFLEPEMRTLQRLSEGWFVKQLDEGQPDVAELTRQAGAPEGSWLPAKMPAEVHDVLLSRGLIPDPRISRNAAQCGWVATKDWAYACRFVTPQGRSGPVRLWFKGLDTLAKAYLNGRLIGAFDNMFREYVVEADGFLRPAGHENILLIIFASQAGYLESLRVPPDQAAFLERFKFLRKSNHDFKSYLGARPCLTKTGIYRDVVLDLPDASWLEDVWVRSRLSEDFSRATVKVVATLAGQACTLRWAIQDGQGRQVAGGRENADPGSVNIETAIQNPQLWWPRTHGRRNLYRLVVTLEHDGRSLDRREVRFGIRQIKLVLSDPATGEKRFAFEINGQLIFLKGANWTPVEGMSHCWDPQRAAKLLDLAEQAEMNILRVWGGGCIPEQDFYDECDRRGILVWQDFMVCYGVLPPGIEEFDENCRQEVRQIIRRLRNHPCILIWSGGNEVHMGWDFKFGGYPKSGNRVFDEIMPEECGAMDPDRMYHGSSPYGGPVPNWPLEGDWHDYSPGSFCPGASVPTFATEIGRASAPGITSMRKFLSEQELWPEGFVPAIRKGGQAIWPEMWGYRASDGAWEKIGPVEEFCDPQSAEELIRVLGTAHGEYLQRRLERQRRGVGDGDPEGPRRCWGSLAWRLNDPWPIVYWSVVDYYLQPKIPYYFLRRSHAPVLVCFERTTDRICVWVVNDSTKPVSGRLILERRTLEGKLRGQLEAQVEVAPGRSKRCLDAAPLGPISLRRDYLHARFGELEATLLLIGERYLDFPPARLRVGVADGAVAIATDNFARQVRISPAADLEGLFEDNYFDMPPGQRRRIKILDAGPAKSLIVCAVNAGPVEVSL